MDPRTLQKIGYGMYIVTSKNDSKVNGQIANTLFQITSDPPTVGVSINRQNLTHEFIEKSGVFAASVLSTEAPLKLIGQFGFKSGRDTDKFAGVGVKTGRTGAPIVLDSALAYFEAEVIKSLDAGTHTLFLGKVIEAEILKDGTPMTYAYYHEVKRGTSPKTAPTYISAIDRVGDQKMDKYKCSVCGYIYDPAKGDPDSGVKPGTPFEQIPADWVCPVCGAEKSAFEKM